MDVSIKIFLCNFLSNEGSYCILQGTRKSSIASFTLSLHAHDKLSNLVFRKQWTSVIPYFLFSTFRYAQEIGSTEYP